MNTRSSARVRPRPPDGLVPEHNNMPPFASRTATFPVRIARPQVPDEIDSAGRCDDATEMLRIASTEAHRFVPTATSGSVLVLVVMAHDASAAETPGWAAVGRHLPIASGDDALLAAMRRLLSEAMCRDAATRGGLAPGGLRRVQAHIEDRLGEKIALAELATIAGLSACHFARAFKRSLGLPPLRYVTVRRVAHAAQLIRTTNRSLTEISAHVGFGDQSHFCRVFRREHGETPRDFRRRHR